MAISLRQLQIFAKVAEYESVTRAAGELGLTQSAVSMALGELESYSDDSLFNRNGKRLHLNDRGRQLLPLAHKLLDQAHEIEMFLDESLQQPIGTLKVGASTTIGNYLMPRLIAEFTRNYSKAQIQLQVGNALQIEKALAAGQLDLGISEGLQQIASLHARKWRDDELVIIVGREHPWAQLSQVDPEQLRQGDWIMREQGSGTRGIFEAALRREGIDCRIAMELGHTEAIKKAVEAGSGCSCLSRMAVARELENGWLVEVATKLNLERDLIILTRGSAYGSALFQTFLSDLKSAVD
jgi:DNA-binding transcriptional LysR family regulator